MADQKTTALTETTTLATTDLFYVVKDVATVPVSRKMTLQSVANMLASIFSGTYFLSDGWSLPSGETWTYASASTFTVPNDMTTRYSKGTKLKMTNVSTKYFYVVSSSYAAPNTTVTVTGGTDYTLANAAITNAYYSYVVNPVGFPGFFVYTPTWACATTPPALGSGTLAGRFIIRANMCLVQIGLTAAADTTFGTGAWSFALPVTHLTGTREAFGFATGRDTGTNNYLMMAQTSPTNTTLSQFKQFDSATNVNTITNTVPFTWANGDSLNIQIEYQF